jgi:hypothetical protein
MSRAIMQQALDALQTDNAWLEAEAPKYVWGRNNQAIAALEAELAKPEQEPKLTDAGADTNIPLWGLKPKGSGMVMFNQSNPEHQPWCDYLNVVLTSMPPQRAKCNCKNAQPEQETVRWFQQFGDTQPEQEPVAWMVRDQVDGCRYPSASKNPAGSINGESQPLYTAPSRKEWVGLTDEEKTSIFMQAEFNDLTERQMYDVVEAKLKEKNK